MVLYPAMPTPLRRPALALLPVVLLVLSATRAAAGFLGSNAPDPIVLLAPPPTAGTDEARDDLDNTARIFARRTPTQVALGKSEADLTVFAFAPVIGDFFSPGRFPKTEALFKAVSAEASAVTSTAKIHWNRPRPYVADPARFPELVLREPSPSYPSGHSTRGTLYSILLSELFPEKRDALLEAGRTAGWVRVEIGVHYPSDVYAGRVLGRALAQAFLRSPEFQQALAEARAELAAPVAK